MQITDTHSAPSVTISPEISLLRLWGEPGEPRFLVVDFACNAQWPGVDVHEPGLELVYVVSGELHDGGKVLPAGTFAVYPANSSHSPGAGASGCRLVVVYPHG